MPELFARAVEEIAGADPDLFVLSGDLLDYPLESMDDPDVKSLAVKDLELVARLMEGLTCTTAVVFGNHDHPDLFRQVFEPLAVDQVVEGLRVLLFLDAEGAGNVPWRQGTEQRRFEDALSDTVMLPQIHVQHYLVWPQRNEDYPHTYGNGESMRRDIVASGVVRLVLSGHYHRGVIPTFNKGVWFATVPAFAESPHPYWLYELSGDQLRWTQHELAGTSPHA
jgi:predicted MPP superfamily phosphohydrolase